MSTEQDDDQASTHSSETIVHQRKSSTESGGNSVECRYCDKVFMRAAVINITYTRSNKNYLGSKKTRK